MERAQDIKETPGLAEAAHRSGFDELMNASKWGGVDPTPQAAGSVGSDPEGGYLVMPILGQQIQSVSDDSNPFRSIARVEFLPRGDAFEEPWDTSPNSAGAAWASETGSRAETDSPDVSVLRVPLHEIYSNPKLTQRLLDDNIYNIDQWYSRKVGQRFADLESTAFVTGNGVGKPQGFLDHTNVTTDDATRTWGELQYVFTGGSGAFVNSDILIDCVHKLKPAYLARARWVMARSTAAVVRQLKDGQGNYLWRQGLEQRQSDSLLGFPVTLLEDMPAIAANSLSIAFGDFTRGYLIVDRPGIRLLRDPYTAKPHVHLYSYKRVGGHVADFNAIKLVKFGTS